LGFEGRVSYGKLLEGFFREILEHYEVRASHQLEDRQALGLTIPQSVLIRAGPGHGVARPSRLQSRPGALSFRSDGALSLGDGP